MKRLGNLYERVCSVENLNDAFYHACAGGKRKRGEVKRFEADLEQNILQLHNELLTHTYKTSPYTLFYLYEPKERLIYRLPFRDRVVQWAIMLVMEPIWTSCLTRDSYACVRNRGIHSCLNRLFNDLQSDVPGTQYCLKLDIRKFYPSINHVILKQVLRKKIKDPDMLRLLDGIIDSVEDGKGVPIGNYLSQYFANVFLSELDHLLKEQYKVRYYYRYADDIVLLGASKRELHGLLIVINQYLHEYRGLELKKNYQIYPVEARGIDFVGYVTYHTHVLARKRNKIGLCREVTKLRKKGLDSEGIRLKLSSRIGFMVHCNSKNLLNKLGINQMKKFSDIRKSTGKLDGSKVHIDSILNRVVRLLAYEIGPSKYRGEMLTIQFQIEEEIQQEDGSIVKEWVKHITFTGSEALMKVFKETELEDYPCEAKFLKQPVGDKGNCFYTVVDPDD